MTPDEVVLGVDAAAGDEEEAVVEGHVVADEAENGKWSEMVVLFLIFAAAERKREEKSRNLSKQKKATKCQSCSNLDFREVLAQRPKQRLCVVVVLVVLVHVVSSVSLPEGGARGSPSDTSTYSSRSQSPKKFCKGAFGVRKED